MEQVWHASMGHLLGEVMSSDADATTRSTTEDERTQSAVNIRKNNKRIEDDQETRNRGPSKLFYREKGVLKIKHTFTYYKDNTVKDVIQRVTDAFFVKNNAIDSFLNTMQDWVPVDSIPEIADQEHFKQLEEAFAWTEDISHLNTRYTRGDYDDLCAEDEVILSEEEREYYEYLKFSRLDNSKLAGMVAARRHRTLSPIMLLRKHFSVVNNYAIVKYLHSRSSQFDSSIETNYLEHERMRAPHLEYPGKKEDLTLDKDDTKRGGFLLPDKTYGFSVQEMYTPTLWTVDDFRRQVTEDTRCNSGDRRQKLKVIVESLLKTFVFSSSEHQDLTNKFPKLISRDLSECAPEYTRPWVESYNTKAFCGKIPTWKTNSKAALIIHYKKQTFSDDSRLPALFTNVDNRGMVEEWRKYAKEKPLQVCLDFLLCTFGRTYNFLIGMYESKHYTLSRDGTKQWIDGSDFPLEEFAFGDYVDILVKYKIPLPQNLVKEKQYIGVFGLIDNGHSLLATCLWRVVNLYRLQSACKSFSNPWLFHQLQLLIDSHIPLMSFMLKKRVWNDTGILEPAVVSYIDTVPPGFAPSFTKSPYPDAPINVSKKPYGYRYGTKNKKQEDEPEARTDDRTERLNHLFAQASIYDGPDQSHEDKDKKSPYYMRSEELDCPLLVYWPSSVDVCTMEEMPDVCQAISMVNPWYETSQKRDKNYPIHAWIHLFVLKLLNRRCAYRNLTDIAQDYFLTYPQFFNYFKLCIKLAHYANFPGVMKRPSFIMRLRNHIGFNFENMSCAQWMTYIDRWNHSALLCLRMFLINCIPNIPAFDNLMRGEQTYARWRAVVRHCMDYYINRFDDTPFPDLEDKIELLYKISEEMCKKKDPSKYEEKKAKATKENEEFLKGKHVFNYTKSSKSIVSGKYYHYTALDEHWTTTEVTLYNVSSKTSKYTMGKIDKGPFENVITTIMKNVYLTIRSIELSEMKEKNSTRDNFDNDSQQQPCSNSAASRKIKDAMNQRISNDIMKDVIEDKHPLCNDTMLNVIAYHVARSQYRKIPTFWLRYLGVCEEALKIFRRWYYLHDVAEMPTNWFKSEVEKFFDKYPKSFNIILSYLSLIIHYREFFPTVLPVDVAKRQIAALRTTFMVDTFDPGFRDMGTCHFCDKCKRWCTVTVKPPETIYNVEFVRDLKEHQLCHLRYLYKTGQIDKSQWFEFINSPDVSPKLTKGDEDNIIFKKCSINGLHLTSKPPKKDERIKLINNPTVMRVKNVEEQVNEPKKASVLTKFGMYDVVTKTVRCALPPSKRRNTQNQGIIIKHYHTNVRMEDTPIDALIDTSDFENVKPKYFIYGSSMWVRSKNPSYDPKKGRVKLGASKAEKERSIIDNIIARYGMDLDENSVARFKDILKRSADVHRALAYAEKRSMNHEEGGFEGGDNVDDTEELERYRMELEELLLQGDEEENNNNASGDKEVENGKKRPEQKQKRRKRTKNSGAYENREFIDEDIADEDLDDAMEERNKERLKGLMSGFKNKLQKNDIYTLIESMAGDIGIKESVENKRVKKPSKPNKNSNLVYSKRFGIEDQSSDEENEESVDTDVDEDDEMQDIHDYAHEEEEEIDDIFGVPGILSGKATTRGKSKGKTTEEIEKKLKDNIDNAQLLFSYNANPGSKKCGSPLTPINMLGCIKQSKGKFYALCCFCGVLCQLHPSNMTSMGPSCGHHGEFEKLHKVYVTGPHQLNSLDLRWKLKHGIYREKDIYEYNHTTPEKRTMRSFLSTFKKKGGSVIRNGCYTSTPHQTELRASDWSVVETPDGQRRQIDVMTLTHSSVVKYDPSEYTAMRCDYCEKYFNKLVKVRVLCNDGFKYRVVKLCESDFRKDVAKYTKQPKLHQYKLIQEWISSKRRKHSSIFRGIELDPEHEMLLGMMDQ